MERRFNAYLRGERSTGFFLVGWGLFSAVAAGLVYTYQPVELLEALLLSVCLLSLVQLYGGIRRLLRARRLHRELHPVVEIAPSSFAVQEIPRLERREQAAMQRRFIEQALFVMGMCFALAGAFRLSGQFLLGTGVGMCIQMSVLLATTLISQWRDAIYRNEIERERGP